MFDVFPSLKTYKHTVIITLQFPFAFLFRKISAGKLLVACWLPVKFLYACPRFTFSFNCCSHGVLILETHALRRELIVASQKTTLLCFCLVYLRFWITINKTQLLFILPQKLIEKNWWRGHPSKRSTWIKLRSLLVLYFCAQERLQSVLKYPFGLFLPETGQFCLDFHITALKNQSHVFLTLTLVYWSHGSAGTPIFCQSNARLKGVRNFCVLCVDHTNSMTNSSAILPS